MQIKGNKIEKSIFINIVLKPISVIIGLVYTPILLNYLGDEKYGVWVTILSIVNWITTFDIGIGNGLRNCITAELVNNDYDAVSKSVSTAYKVLSGVVFIIYVSSILIGKCLDWNSILNTSLEVDTTLIIILSFVCINFVLSLQNNCYYAIQESEVVAIINVIIQLVNLIGVFLITKLSSKSDELIKLALTIGLSGLLVNLFFTIKLWRKRDYFRPKLFQFERAKLKEICSLGIKFFVIQIAGVILFTTDSIIISNLFGPSEVTPYNTAYKVFGIGMSCFSALLIPFWSRFTVAREKNDFLWMKNTIKKIRYIWLGMSLLFVIAIPIFKPVVNIWLGKELYFEPGLIASMVIYYILYMYSGIYSTALNGIGDINLQLGLSVISAIINIPLSIIFAKVIGLGTTGICLGTIFSLLIGDIAFTIQMNNIIKKGCRNT